jgi:hypothetical protein
MGKKNKRASAKKKPNKGKSKLRQSGSATSKVHASKTRSSPE